MDKITIYTDGAAKGNPGRGGYGVVLLSGKFRKELSQGFRLTTNNRMELLSVIVALEALKHENSEVVIYSDSEYVVKPVKEGWVFDWQKKNFKKKKNVDLWQRFLKIYPKHKINFVWIKGHSNIVENERCDELAVQASNGKELLVDEVYEMQQSNIETNSSLFI